MEAANISPFELHLILKLERGQTLTPNEVRKAQLIGIDSVLLPVPGVQPENSNPGDQGDDSDRKKQKVHLPHRIFYDASCNAAMVLMKLTKCRPRPRRARMMTVPSGTGLRPEYAAVLVAIPPQRMRRRDILRQTGKYTLRNIPMARLPTGCL